MARSAKLPIYKSPRGYDFTRTLIKVVGLDAIEFVHQQAIKEGITETQWLTRNINEVVQQKMAAAN